jgi:hypothetical protein
LGRRRTDLIECLLERPHLSNSRDYLALQIMDGSGWRSGRNERYAGDQKFGCL